MNTYKEIARAKYQIYSENKKKQELIKEQEHKKQEMLEELIKERELKYNNIINEIEELIISLEINNLPEIIKVNLNLIQNIIQNNIIIIKEHNINNIQNMTLNIIDILNKHSEIIKLDVKNISVIMKEIFILVEMDIDIELMDTSNDEEYARKLAEEIDFI